jgi:hypothetical protein
MRNSIVWLMAPHDSHKIAIAAEFIQILCKRAATVGSLFGSAGGGGTILDFAPKLLAHKPVVLCEEHHIVLAAAPGSGQHFAGRDQLAALTTEIPIGGLQFALYQDKS